ncbi:DUF3048 domain-containing protein [Candidatus Falkowbacteria bacterium]|nr:DUF3048 domain-containing protein [Candidatus Falkowbacteria bacterium]
MKELFSKIIAFVKKQPRIWLVVSLLLISVFVVAGGGYLLLSRTSFLDFFSRNSSAQEISNVNSSSENGFYRLIDGVAVSDETKINPPLFAVQIENMVDARPLSGVSGASLVYETLAEAGITRLLAVYAADDDVPEIGPVRSARPYFLDWAEEYGALYAHSGGSPEALRLIPQYDIFDLNEFANGRFFWRSKSRYMPHNLYTSVELLNEAFAAKNGEVKIFSSWQFKNEVLAEARPSEEKRAKIYFSTKTYEVGWQYDREANDYLRYQAGVIQQDRDGSEVRAKNIIVQLTDVIVLDDVGRKDIETQGSGDAIVFQDGVRIDGTWRKETRGDRTKFFDATGAEIKFNPGVTWVEVVPIDTEVEF